MARRDKVFMFVSLFSITHLIRKSSATCRALVPLQIEKSPFSLLRFLACGAGGGSIEPRVERGGAEPWVSVENNLLAHGVGGSTLRHHNDSVSLPRGLPINGCRPLRGLIGRLAVYPGFRASALHPGLYSAVRFAD